jgi:hypoxanthine phosphoribosyltransferase
MRLDQPNSATTESLRQIDRVILTQEQIAARIAALGEAISTDYEDKDLILVGVLRGVLFFMADLLRAITIPVKYDFIAISRYGPTAQTRGVVRLTKDLDEHIEGRHVLFVEDVIDTGLTSNYILKNLRAREPASLKVCALLDRPQHRLIDLNITYKGFELPDLFLVGYGLDYQQMFRNLPFIATLKAGALGRPAAPRDFQPRGNV